ncbi:IS66 family insertion sequence element accessory protein TnpB [Gluconacetobacter dulcium]|uniref:IS66 family insertion sequence element accessory protein TnpB n=1 Tax=Gluconacetobacter dulcium TaxID=2729096 RepID=UPI0021809FD1|nr:IS66 family insertion sequence element accessory protein TnpB [Gluconacetobacter dulcium]
MRKGISGLAALAQNLLRQNPTSGTILASRGRRCDRIKLLTWDDHGFGLYYKVLDAPKGRFPWPSPANGVARLTAAQVACCGKDSIGGGRPGRRRPRG